MLERVSERIFTAEEGLAAVFPSGRAAVQEGIASSDMNLERRGVREPANVAHVQRRQ